MKKAHPKHNPRLCASSLHGSFTAVRRQYAAYIQTLYNHSDVVNSILHEIDNNVEHIRGAHCQESKLASSSFEIKVILPHPSIPRAIEAARQCTGDLEFCIHP